jgi:hypothetical protein
MENYSAIHVEMLIELVLSSKNNLDAFFPKFLIHTLGIFAVLHAYTVHTTKILSVFHHIFCMTHLAYLLDNTNYDILHFRCGQLSKGAN